MSEKQFTTVSMGMEEAYCDFSIIKVGDKIISDGIPTTDAIEICDLLNEQQATISQLKEENEQLRQANRTLGDNLKQEEEENANEYNALLQENEYFRKSRDKWKTKALQKDEQLQDCDKDCFNCRFYNKVCDFCTKFHIYTMTSGDKDG